VLFRSNTSAVTALSLTISGSVDKIKSSDASYKKVYDDFTALKDKATDWYEKNLVPLETQTTKAYDLAKGYATEYDALKASYDTKYAEWEMPKGTDLHVAMRQALDKTHPEDLKTLLEHRAKDLIQ
jgi:hypothetical protein